MRNGSSSAVSLTYPAAAPFALLFGYVAIVALFRRSGLFDLTYHVIVLVLIGFSIGGGSPFREVATAMLATLLAASVFAYLFGIGTRDPRGQGARKFHRRTATLGRASGPPTPSDAR